MGVTVKTLGNDLRMTLPPPVIRLTGVVQTANLSLSLPSPRIAISGVTGSIGSLRMKLPPPSISLAGGGNLFLSLPVPALRLIGTTGVIGDLVMRWPFPLIHLTGHLDTFASLVMSLPPPSILLTGRQHGLGSFRLTLPAPTMFFRGTSGVVGSLLLQLPAPKMALSGFINTVGRLLMILPPPSIYMVGDQTLVKIFKGFAMNTSLYAVTDYTDCPFNSLARFNGEVLGGGENGISKLDGKTDNGNPINARIGMPMIDIFTTLVKRARDAWLSCRTDGQLMLVLEINEHDPYFDVFTRTDTKIHEDRAKLPKGIKDRFISFEIRNVDGSDFDIDGLRLTVDNIRRRVR